jgi:tetratricopeptide (TPR) repeat protein/S1-C subfamily serine protease
LSAKCKVFTWHKATALHFFTKLVGGRVTFARAFGRLTPNAIAAPRGNRHPQSQILNIIPMKKLLFTTLLLTSSFLQASIFPAHSNPIPTSPQITQIDPNEGLLTPQQVQETAKSISVRITSENNGGSGVLIAQKGGNYLVLTNAHVVRRSTQLEIQAPDGQKYKAKQIDGGFSSKYDLALLQFTSKTKYTLAKVKDVAASPIDPPRVIYSAGFPFDSKDLRITQGEVSQLTDIPFDDGTQIGYTIDKGKKGIRQGMSGGAIFDSQGNFLGINTIGVAPILPDYTYNDGSRPIAKLKSLYARANWGIPVYNFLTNVKAEILYSYDNLPKVEHQVTPTGYMAKLNDKARKMTVRIETSGGSGSGVIVAKEGNSYYVLTAKHVVRDADTNRELTNSQVITYDQDAHPVTSTVVAEGVDMAVVKFSSSSNYQVAKLGKYSTKDEDLAFVGGFPGRDKIKSPLWQWQLNPGYISSRESGKLRTQNDQSFTEGYDLIYGSISYGGMSGGPVFDTNGNVIGIHGKGEGADLNSLGISIQTFIGLATKLQVTPNLLAIDPNHPSNLAPTDRSNVIAAMQNISPPQAVDSGQQWLAYGNQLYRTRQNDRAVAAFDNAIANDKDNKLLLAANYGKALVLHRAKKFDLATTAIAQAIAVVPAKERTNYYYLWNWQSVILRRRYKFDEAIRSIDIAIGLKPDDLNLRHEKTASLMGLGRNKEGIAIESEIIRIKPEWYFYMIRAVMKSTLGDMKGALEDQNMGIKLNPDHENSYVARSWLRSQMGDKKGAIEDVELAVKLNPNSDHVYRMRARFKSDAGDKEGAMADINKAIQIAPENADAYFVRAGFKNDLKDYEGAIKDLNRSIQIDPYDVNAYVDRGSVKSEKGDPQGAIIDLNKALEIDPNFYLAYTRLILVKSEIGDNKGVIEDCNKALKLKPKYDSYYYFRGRARAQLKDNKGAIEDYSKAIELKPGEAGHYFSRGSTKSKIGDKKGAINDLNQAIKIEPKKAPYYYSTRGGVKNELDDKQGALLDLNKAIELDSKYTVAYGLRADIKLELGDEQGAIADYTQAIKLDPKFAGAYRMRGFVKSDLGNKREAILDYDKAIELNPKYADAYINRSVAKFELGDNAGAILDTEKAIVINPNSALAYANLGDFKIIDSKEREALPDLERAIKLDPKMSYAYAGRGIVRETLGDRQGAISDYKQALKLNPQILTEWKKQAESVGKYNAASYQKYQQIIQKLEAGSKL